MTIKTKILSLAALFFAASPALAQPADLSVYAGLYPHDEVEGVAFVDHPLVTDAVLGVVQSVDLQKTLLKQTVASATVIPIREIDGQLLMWAFDPPSAGNYNWGLLISPDGQKIAVCEGTYEDGGFVTEWHTENGPQRITGFQCPDAEEDLAAFEAVLGD